MTAQPTQREDHRLDPKRGEQVALGGLGLQALVALVVVVMASMSRSQALSLISVQAGIGILFWLITWMHLRLRRGVREEAYDLREAEQRRRQQGVDTLFEDGQQGPAARNLSHMDSYIAPAASFLLSLFLLGALFYYVGLWVFQKIDIFTLLKELPTLNGEYALAGAAISVCTSLALFLLGTYASGLSREPNGSLLRAGAGYMRSTALFLFVAAVALALSNRGWMGDWPDRAVAALVVVWMTLHAAEILVNGVFDFYRPRLAGVESRPAYDSRLSGLLAEPEGIFRTFAHTMDYQFGFKISETWFFLFLEKAFAPLILVQVTTFYLLTCFVVVAPGEAAIVQAWGAPRGVKNLPEANAEWDRLSAPLGPGLHLKWPWPIETTQVIKREQIKTLYVGFGAVDEEEAREKAIGLELKTVSWDQEHIKEEYKYLMPLPDEMRDASTTVPLREAPGERRPDNALFLSGTFSIDYRIGDQPGDIYRYAYNHRNPTETLRMLLEREITAYMAGAHFWDLMVNDPHKAHIRIREGLQAAVDGERMGLRILNVFVQNIHPPAGETGKAYQEVLATRQKTKALIYDGEIAERKILGLVESQKQGVVAKADAYKYRRRVVAEAEAKRFCSQMKADRAAPGVYRTRLRLQAIEEGIAGRPLTIRPANMDVWFDMSKMPTPEELEIQKGILKQAQNP